MKLIGLFLLILQTNAPTTDSDDLSKPNKYFVFHDRIENSQKETVVRLEKYEIYTTNIRHDSSHDDGRRLRLYSNLGFVLENIPLYDNRFYNECVEIFLEAEKELPAVRLCMRKNKMNVRNIQGLKLSFPKKPALQENGYTQFWCANCNTCTKDGEYKVGGMWIAGLYISSTDIIYVTYQPDHYHIISAHEYIHACGYRHVCGSDKELEKRNFACAEKTR